MRGHVGLGRSFVGERGSMPRTQLTSSQIFGMTVLKNEGKWKAFHLQLLEEKKFMFPFRR